MTTWNGSRRPRGTSVGALCGASMLAFAASPGACSSSSSSGPSVTENLILNPGAEAALGSSDGTPVKTPDWTSAGEATAMKYGVEGFAMQSDPGPPDRGKNYFCGGVDDDLSSLTQTVDVSAYGGAIDGGHVSFVLSGWLGGYAGQEDYATLTATFLDASGAKLGSQKLGPVTAEDRGDTTEMLERSATGSVPPGARSVKLVLEMVREEGNNNDGHADNLSLVLDGI